MRILAALLLSLLIGAALVGLGPAPAALAVDAPVVTGETWMKSPPGERMAFLAGMAVVVSRQYRYLQRQTSGTSTPAVATGAAREGVMVKEIVERTRPFTLMQIMQDVDKYYAAHPDQLQRQVVDVIWNDIAVPNQPSR
jgi:hypothetical protein